MTLSRIQAQSRNATTAAPTRPMLVTARPRGEFAAATRALPGEPGAIPVNANERSGDGSFALPLQRKLAVGSVRDPHELEADAMAARVLGGGDGRADADAGRSGWDGADGGASRSCTRCCMVRGSRSMEGRGR